MIRALLCVAILTSASVAAAQPAPVTRTLRTLSATTAGQPIVAPSGPLEVTASETLIPANGRIAPHKHPYPRYVYVAAGRVQVTNLVTGETYELKAGDVSIDPVDQWHEAKALDGAPARLVAVDQTPPGVSNVIRKP